MLKTVYTNPWVQAIAVLLAVALLFIVARVLSPVLVPLFIALLVAYIFDPVVDVFEKRKIPRGISIALLGIIFVVVCVTVPLFIIPNIVLEADRLIAAASAAAQGSENATGWADRLVAKIPLADIARYLELVPVNAQDADARAILAERVGAWIRDNALQVLRGYAPQLMSAGTSAAQMVASVGKGIVGTAAFIGNIALFGVVAVYLLHDFDRIVAQAGDLVPLRYRGNLGRVLGKVDEQLRAFFRGQLTVCACLGGMYAAGFLMSGVPFGIILGLIGGVASFIPYLGLTITCVPAVLLTLLAHGASWHVAGVAATFVVAQSIEGMVLTPKIVGDKVGLGPVWVILAIMVFGSMLGFLGLLLAVPTAAVLKVLVQEALAAYRGSSFFSTSGEAAGMAAPSSRSRGRSAAGRSEASAAKR